MKNRFLLCFILCINIFIAEAEAYIDLYKSQLHDFRNIKWNNITKNNLSFNEKDIVNKINIIIENINKNINNETIIIIPGHIKIRESEDLFIDYDEIFENRIKNIIYIDNYNKIKVMYDNYFFYFIDISGLTPLYFRCKEFTLNFEPYDFTSTGYNLTDFNGAIKKNLYKTSVIEKDYILNMYNKLDKKWKWYVIENGSNLFLFRDDIEYNLKYETIPIPMFGIKPKPSVILPIWKRMTRFFSSSGKSIDFLNELLSIPNFYEVWKDRHTNWINDINTIKLSDFSMKLLKTTEKTRTQINDSIKNKYYRANLLRNVITDLTGDEAKNLLMLNRSILEDTFPLLCPKKLEISLPKEIITGDITDEIDLKSAKYLFDCNAINLIFYKKTDSTNDMTKKNIETPEEIILSLQLDKNPYKNKNYKIIKEGFNKVNNQISFNNTKYIVKNKLPLVFYFNSLDNYYKNNKQDVLFESIFDSECRILSYLSSYTKNIIFINNKRYFLNDFKTIAYLTLQARYEYLKDGVKRNLINLSDTNWEIPLPFLNLGEGVFSLDYLNILK